MNNEQHDTDSGAALKAMPQPQVFDIHIAADGSWFHEGGLIRRPALVRLFASVLQRDSDGGYWLVTPVERGSITVADAPFVVTAMTCENAGRDQTIHFRTNVDDSVTLTVATPLRMHPPAGVPDGQPLPYVLVRDGLEAKLARPVFYELAALAVPDDKGRLGVWSGGHFFRLDG